MEDLIPINRKVASFMGVTSNTLGTLIANIVMQPKEVRYGFFVIDNKPSYSVVLGRD